MPAGSGEDAQRFADAVEWGRSPDSVADDELARELVIVARLRARGRQLDPSPADRARARQRLLTLLAEPSRRAGTSPGRLASPGLLADTAADPAAAELLRQVSQVRAAPTDRVRLDPTPVSIPAPLDDPTRFERLPTDDRTSAGTDPVPADAAAATLLRGVSPGAAADPTLPADAVVTDPAEPRSAGGSEMPARPASTARPPRRLTGRHSLPGSPPVRRDGTRPMRDRAARRYSLIGSAALLMLITLIGVGMFGSRDALPGQTLYGVKRVAESAGLALTFDELNRGRRHLELASIRLDEVERLVAADPQLPAEQPELVNSTIAQFDDSTGTAARILLDTDANDGGVDARQDLHAWANTQLTRLAQLKPALPDSTGADDALELLDRVMEQSSCDKKSGAAASCTGSGSSRPDHSPDPAADPAGEPEPSSTTDTSVLDPTSTDVSTAVDDPRRSGTSTPGSVGSKDTPKTSRENPSESPDPPEDADSDGDGPSGDGALGGTSRAPAPSNGPTVDSADEDDDGQPDDDTLGDPPGPLPQLLPGLGL